MFVRKRDRHESRSGEVTGCHKKSKGIANNNKSDGREQCGRIRLVSVGEKNGIQTCRKEERVAKLLCIGREGDTFTRFLFVFFVRTDEQETFDEFGIEGSTLLDVDGNVS